MTERRFPFPDYPDGWFRVGYSAELKPGEVQPIKYFGRELVLFRSESGKPSVLDAYCPHLGAHLGYGGKVKGENIECPFHAWQLDARGEVAQIPYASKVPPRARTVCHEVREHSGLIMLWHHHEKKAPSF